MIKVKATVRPRSLWIMAAAANVAEQQALAGITVTSGNDSKHMAGSKHGTDEALDLRSKHLKPSVKRAFLAAVLARLGAGYEGFIEHEGTTHEHIHIEFDPS